ncbi:MAG: glycosyl transferase [Thermosynechococcus sp.]|uniref:glycosyltransferase n=1 Tax=Thermosynechococcus sp. TaxID=2814275 RepID=UPI00220C7A5C|nr:glycosyltransferase [Thermosynechococcus sp.]BCX12108.1 MAG: glycosyl transferase [Thermosynechococcus sp.]
MSRTVFLVRKLDPGGAERQLVALSRGLKERGRDVNVVLFYQGGVFDAELSAAGVPLHFVGKQGRWDVAGFLLRLTRILRTLRPTTIYSFLDMPNVLASLLWLLIGRPRLVWSIRAAGMEMRHYDWLARLVAKLEAALSGTADVVVANSQAGRSWGIRRGFPPGRIVVIENGIDTARFRFDSLGRQRVRSEWKIGADQTAIGLVARLDVMKDHRNFLQACALLAARRENLRFVCVGSGPADYLAELKTFAQTLGIADRVIWAGPRSDMPAVLSALDIASSSSFGEGFSNAIAEAMACERPCVVTDVGDSARIVGDTGMVVPPRDAEALASALGKGEG